jgi:hypothetical protein
MGPSLRLIPLAPLALAVGCGLMLDDLAGGAATPDASDTASDPDAGAEPCPGYSGFDVECCTLDDPCGWGADGYCDCDGTCDWDEADCGGGPDGGPDGGAFLATRRAKS